MATVLVVDDDGHIREVVRYALTRAGHTVVEAADGRAALATFEAQAVDLVVLDIVMPEEDGLEVCRRIRARSEVPIIFLSSRDEEIDRVLGLELGADDYVTKPFSPRELVARVKARLRRRTPPETPAPPEDAPRPAREHAALRLDRDRHLCTWSGQAVILTATEFALLWALLGYPGRVYARHELVDRAWGPGHHITDRTIDSHVRRIRHKLGAVDPAAAEAIETVYGVGYRLRT